MSKKLKTLTSDYFKTKNKIKYNRKLSGRFRLYLRDRNSMQDIACILSLYNTDNSMYN